MVVRHIMSISSAKSLETGAPTWPDCSLRPLITDRDYGWHSGEWRRPKDVILPLFQCAALCQGEPVATRESLALAHNGLVEQSSEQSSEHAGGSGLRRCLKACLRLCIFSDFSAGCGSVFSCGSYI